MMPIEISLRSPFACVFLKIARFLSHAPLVLVFVLANFALGFQAEPQQNSTEKFRVVANDISVRAGTAVRWETEYLAALEQSKMSGKPIFWYVPTVRGTFMDRQTEIDRYMMAGPFSWPSIVNLINEQFIPLRANPKRLQSDRFGIEVYKFVEPGFLVINPDESLRLSADRLTTLHPHWLFKQLASSVDEQRNWWEVAGQDADVAEWWNRAQASHWQLPPESVAKLLNSNNVELELLGGMLQFFSGDHAGARASWKATGERHREHPLGWKAACEAQGIGPLYRGFEVFEPLSESLPGALDKQTLLNTPVDSKSKRLTSQCPEPIYSTEQLWQLGTNYLLRMQDRSGGYFDSDYDFGGTDSLPNVHVAVSSLVGLALIEAAKRETDPARRERIDEAIDRLTKFVSDDKNLNLIDRDEILWAQAYRVQFLAAMNGRGGENKFQSELQNAVRGLEAIQLANGSWYHEYANSFVSATALNALFLARSQGAEVNSDKVELGLKRIESQRFKNGAYPYATRSARSDSAGDEDKVAASGGRVSICELARSRWGRVEEAELVGAVNTSLKHHELLARALKYDDHTSTYEYGGFFFWYDMQARSEAIELIQNPTTREELSRKQLSLLLSLPELDGCFVDSHELGRCYGTAMALISLSHVEP